MDHTHDTVVLGGTAGGIATAVRAAREDDDVLLVTYNEHLGGMMAGGLSYTDTLTMKARAPLLEEFVERVRTHYRDTYGEDSDQFDHCENGYIFEPHVAEEIFEAFVDEEPSLTTIRGYHPVSIERSGSLITTVTFESFGDEAQLEVAGETFVDATYEGDLAVQAGVPYRIGREDRHEFGEQFAGKLYTQARGDQYYPLEAVGQEDRSVPAGRKGPLDVPPEKRTGGIDLIPHPAGLTEIFSKSTGEGDDAIQAYNYRLCMTKDPENRRRPEKPPGYDRADFLEALEDIKNGSLRSHLLLRYLPNEKADMNAADLPGENHDYPEADWDRREEIATQHRRHALGLLYFLHNDDAVPAEIQEEAREWGLAKDEFEDNANFPWQLYVREARRIEGRYTFTENDARCARGIDRTPAHSDSIAIAEYPLDSHACFPDRQVGSQPEGFFYASQVTRPSQVPYRCLLPQGVDNLIVPVALSATHVAFGTIRLEPTWMHIGEAAGYAVTQADADHTPVADVEIDALQQTLVEDGVMVSFFNEFDMATDQPWVPAIQYLGARGYFDSYDAAPTEPLSEPVARDWLHRTAAQLTDQAHEPLTTHNQATANPISAADFQQLASKILPMDANDFDLEDDQQLTRGKACELLYSYLET